MVPHSVHAANFLPESAIMIRFAMFLIALTLCSTGCEQAPS